MSDKAEGSNATSIDLGSGTWPVLGTAIEAKLLEHAAEWWSAERESAETPESFLERVGVLVPGSAKQIQMQHRGLISIECWDHVIAPSGAEKLTSRARGAVDSDEAPDLDGLRDESPTVGSAAMSDPLPRADTRQPTQPPSPSDAPASLAETEADEDSGVAKPAISMSSLRELAREVRATFVVQLDHFDHAHRASIGAEDSQARDEEVAIEALRMWSRLPGTHAASNSQTLTMKSASGSEFLLAWSQTGARFAMGLKSHGISPWLRSRARSIVELGVERAD